MFRSFAFSQQTKSVRLFGSLAICLATAFIGLLALSRPASAAAPCVFQAQQNNDFVNIGNWSCGHTPTLGDDVWISAGTTTNLNATSSIIVQSVSVSGTLNVVSGFFEATSSATIILQGTVTSTSGIMRFNTVSSTGNFGTGTGTIHASSTIQNNGTFDVGGGAVTSTGSFTNASTTRSGSGNLTFQADFTNTGTFTAAGGLVRVMGAIDQSIAGVLYNRFFSSKTGGVATFAASTTILTTLTADGVGGTLSGGATALTVVATSTILSGASVSSTSGALVFTGDVTSTGQLGSVSGNQLFSGLLQNNGTFGIGSGTATTTGNLTNATSGVINNNTGVLVMVSNFTNSGTFTAGTGTVRLHNGNAQDIGAATFYKLTVQKTDGTVATMTGNSTVSNAYTLVTGILSVNTRTFTVSGTYTNTGGQVTISSGSIVHASTNAFTESDGTSTSTVQATFTANGSLYVTLTDGDRNLSATNTETMTVTVAATSASGSDSESLTLTETTASSGIFRNTTALPLAYVINATVDNGTLSIHASDTGTATYTDTLDAADITTDTVTLTLSVPTPVATTNTGGPGGGGGSGSVTLFNYTNLATPVAPVSTATNLPLTYAANTLVKLANDGNTATQQDSAVYYYGRDGRRHAFPNDKAYFTWYSDFNQVQIISAADMARMPLGQNVTYRPGVRMVKFATLNNVYAVDAGGLLHWVKTEAIATSLYGSTWNKQIDDINDAFFANYRFGSEINSTADFAPSAVTTAASSIQKDMGF
jgi:hypothetical protein